MPAFQPHVNHHDVCVLCLPIWGKFSKKGLHKHGDANIVPGVGSRVAQVSSFWTDVGSPGGEGHVLPASRRAACVLCLRVREPCRPSWASPALPRTTGYSARMQLACAVSGVRIFVDIFFKKDFIYPFMIDIEREREAETRREKQAPCREPDAGPDPGSPGSRPGPKAGAKLLSPPGCPKADTLVAYGQLQVSRVS